MRLKGKRAVFRQILAGDPLEAQICHFGPANHHFEAKMKQFDAKIKHFEPKMKHFEHLDGFGGQIFQNESRIFFDEILMRLKGKRAVFRQILAGDPLEAQICHFGPANHHLFSHGFEPQVFQGAQKLQDLGFFSLGI